MMNVTAFLKDRKVSKPKRWENAKKKETQSQGTGMRHKYRTGTPGGLKNKIIYHIWY